MERTRIWPDLLAAVLASCTSGARLERVPSPASDRSPAADARTAIAHGDRRFLLRAGPWVWSTPGVDSTCTDKLGSKRLRLIEVVGDVVSPPTGAADSAQEVAGLAQSADLAVYAREYNRVIAAETGTCTSAAAP